MGLGNENNELYDDIVVIEPAIAPPPLENNNANNQGASSNADITIDVNKYIDTPQELISLLRSDFTLAEQVMKKLNRTQVRALIKNAYAQQYDIHFQLWNLFSELFVAKPLKINNITLDKVKERPAKESLEWANIIRAMLDSGMLTQISFLSTFGRSAGFEYQNGKDNLLLYKGSTDKKDPTKDARMILNEDNAAIAYTDHQKRQHVLSSFSDMLKDFFQKSNIPINSLKTDFALACIEKIKKIKHWTLLAEVLLHLEDPNIWRNDFNVNKVLWDIKRIDDSSNSDHQRCLFIVKEKTMHQIRINNFWCSDVDDDYEYPITLDPIQFSFKKGNEANARGTFQQFTFGQVNITGKKKLISQFTPPYNSDELKTLMLHDASRIDLACYHVSHQISPIDPSEFIKKLFSDVFSYTTYTNLKWVGPLVDLNPVIQQDQALQDKLGEMVTWEMFDAVNDLMKPLSTPAITTTILRWKKEAWDTIDEFPHASNLLATLAQKLLMLTPEEYASFSNNLPYDLLRALLQKNLIDEASELFIKFNAFYENNPNVPRLLDMVEARISAKISNDYTQEITENPALIQRTLFNFMTNPQAFIDVLSQNFFLAYRYFNRMHDASKELLIKNAQDQNLPLIEMLMKFFSLHFPDKFVETIRIENPFPSNTTYHHSDLTNFILTNSLPKQYHNLNQHNYYLQWMYFSTKSNAWKIAEEKAAYSHLGFTTYSIFYPRYRELKRKIILRQEINKMLLDIFRVSAPQILEFADNADQANNVFIGIMLYADNELSNAFIFRLPILVFTRLISNMMNDSREDAITSSFNEWLIRDLTTQGPLYQLFAGLGGKDAFAYLNSFLSGNDLTSQKTKLLMAVALEKMLEKYDLHSSTIYQIIDWLKTEILPRPDGERNFSLLMKCFNSNFFDSILTINEGNLAAKIYYLYPDFFEKNFPLFHMSVTRNHLVNPYVCEIEESAPLVEPPPYVNTVRPFNVEKEDEVEQKNDAQDEGREDLEEENRILRQQLSALKGKAPTGTTETIAQMNQRMAQMQEQMLMMMQMMSMQQTTLSNMTEALNGSSRVIFSQIYSERREGEEEGIKRRVRFIGPMRLLGE